MSLVTTKDVRATLSWDGWKVKKIIVGNHVNPEDWHLPSDDFYFR